MAEQSFEKDLDRLESIVAALEEGELSLDDSLKRFEEGIKIAQRCEKALMQAEKKIEMLTRKANGAIVAEAFGDGADEQAETEAAATESGQADSPCATDAPSDEDEEEEEGEMLF